MATEYGFGAEDVAGMTMAQLYYYGMSDEDAKRIDTGRLDEANALLMKLGEEQRKADKKARRRKK